MIPTLLLMLILADSVSIIMLWFVILVFDSRRRRQISVLDLCVLECLKKVAKMEEACEKTKPQLPRRRP